MRTVVGNDKQKIAFSSSSRPTNSNNSTLRGIHINISSDPFQHRIPPYIQRLWQESKFRKHLSTWKRRLGKKYQQSGWLGTIIVVVGFIATGIILLIHVGFFSGKKYQDWQHEHYSEHLDEVDLLDKVYPDEGRAQTTAIMVLKKEKTSSLLSELEHTIQPILEQLCQYDMFNNFMIWNDDPFMTLTLDMIHVEACTPNKLTVLNAPAKLGTSARYHACQQAKTPYCYFQDIPRKSLQLRSTYANFLKSPQLIHGESSDHDSYINSQWRYCFSNTDLELHTCYVDIESGTFVAKAMVSQFLHNYDRTSVVDDFADMYFTMYMNQVPYQLEGEGSYSKEFTNTELEHMDLGLTMLYNDLVEQEGIVPLKPYLESTTLDRNARCSCKDDRCLFLANVQVTPSIDLFSYTPTVDVELSRKMHDDYKANFREHRYSNAVDGDERTSWKSTSNIKAGDYIGLDMLLPMRNSIIYRFLVNHPYSYRSGLSIQISYDGLLWIKSHPTPSVSCQNIDVDDLQLLECRFILTDTGYRYVRLESQRDHDFKFDVYDFSFSAKVKKDTNGQLLDISFNEDGIAYVEDD